ncbi:hypothetical protein U0070_022780 [Myodes glareolus]|uniref:Uncharacterized protein n=1 Tax=Myodes glareolus TaxID=447135 RepID=A0AAW0HHR7_MYOGA
MSRSRGSQLTPCICVVMSSSPPPPPPPQESLPGLRALAGDVLRLKRKKRDKHVMPYMPATWTLEITMPPCRLVLYATPRRSSITIGKFTPPARRVPRPTHKGPCTYVSLYTSFADTNRHRSSLLPKSPATLLAQEHTAKEGLFHTHYPVKSNKGLKSAGMPSVVMEMQVAVSRETRECAKSGHLRDQAHRLSLGTIPTPKAEVPGFFLNLRKLPQKKQPQSGDPKSQRAPMVTASSPAQDITAARSESPSGDLQRCSPAQGQRAQPFPVAFFHIRAQHASFLEDTVTSMTCQGGTLKWKTQPSKSELYQQKLGKGKEILRNRKYYDPVKEPREGLSKNDQEADLAHMEIQKDEISENKNKFETCLDCNIYQVLSENKTCNLSVLFLPGCMVRVINFNDDANTDIPINIIHSKNECLSMKVHTTLTQDDIVISKLIQILAYPRQEPERYQGAGHPRKTYQCWAQEWEQDLQTMEGKGQSCSEKSKVDGKPRVADLVLSADWKGKELPKKPEDTTSPGCCAATGANETVDSKEERNGPGQKKDSLFHWDLDKQKENSRYVENKVLSMSTSQCGVQTPEGWKTRYSKESSDSNKLSSPWKIHAVTGEKKRLAKLYLESSWKCCSSSPSVNSKKKIIL